MEAKWMDEGEQLEHVEDRLVGTRPGEYAVSIIAGLAADDPSIDAEKYENERPTRRSETGIESALKSESAYVRRDDEYAECLAQFFGDLYASVSEALNKSGEFDGLLERDEKTREIQEEVMQGNYLMAAAELDHYLGLKDEQFLLELFMETMQNVEIGEKRVLP